MFTARVPGFGLVEWSREQVNDYARELQRSHRPERLSIAWRSWWRLRWPVVVESQCKRCGEPWPCPAAWWADRHQDTSARESSLR